ncbi:uncharacterized protein LOC105205313 isoform X2 [Solenopsis invicta]|uniref:uncharacterized protein LOC105205313 isoform X2 n=1 Tax=Solenopsis invicta TaxID=13686 RepID=UPI000595A35B|nr:uncharacterized protein LOC105205313 isoform X2 [Solenopsis invicta]
MQNWNQWQLSAGVTTPMPQPPIGYAPATSADPMTLMQSYMQYYNQPAPTGYTPEQWAVVQQQGWTQWQQWQQQYQQWHTQYGDKYQEMKHLSAQDMNLTGQMQTPSNAQLPPLPKEETRPPLPPTTYQFNVPPPHQNNLPLFPTKESANKTVSQANVTNYPANPPLPTTSQPPLPPEIGENRENVTAEKSSSNVTSDSNSAKKLNFEDDDLTEAEKTFDAQFKQWEEQFNAWKQQNANHPDKTQYKQYEAKWTTWREKLLERREQMRKKREQQRQAAAKAEAEKNKNIPGDDKILNILSNTENQRLINNLLGIGKTLGLTGKQNISASILPPPPPPPLPATTNSSIQPTQGMQQTPTQVNMIRPAVPNWSDQQQWGNQPYNPRIEAPGYGPGMAPTVPPMLSTPDVGPPPQMVPSNFSQPQLNLPNFSQPPPNFPPNNRMQLQNVNAPVPANMKDCPPFGPTDSSNTDVRFMPNERPPHNFDGPPPNFRKGDQECFGRDNTNSNLPEQDQFRPPADTFNKIDAQHFRKGDKNFSDFGNNQLNSQNNFNQGNDRFGPSNDRLGPGNNRFNKENRFGSIGGDRFGSNNDRIGPGSDRFNNEWFGQEGDRFRPGNDRPGMDKDRSGLGNDRFPNNERFGSDRFAPGGDQFVPGTDRFDPKDRFFSGNDRFGPNNENFRQNDRFGRGNPNYFEPKDSADNRRDSFGTNARGFNRNPSFSPPKELPPELKKLMEKRKAAGDVFRPSFVDSDKSTSIGSLSESFKKITGDSPFRSSFDFQKNSPNRSAAGNSGPSSFPLHSSSDSGQISTSPFGPRGPLFNRDELPFRGHLDNFAKHNPTDYNERGKNMEIRPHPNQSEPINIQSQDVVKQPENIETADSHLSLQTDNIADTKDTEVIQEANEANSSIEQNNTVVFVSSKNDNGEENKVTDNDNSLQQDDQKHDDNQIQSNIVEKTDESNNNDNDIKQPESLPFMGENDVPPEDLNMEPPPELPNLCPISDSSQNIQLNKNFDKQGPTDNQFGMRCNSSFGPRGMEFKPGAPFGPRGPMFGPRGPHRFPPPSLFSQSSMNVQLGPRGPKDGQFGLNVPSESRFSPRRSNEEQCGDRDELSELPNSEKFDPRGPTDKSFGQFGPRMPINARFGLRGPIRQFGPRGPTDLPFSLRNLGPFGPRGHSMQFGPRGPNDGLYGPRGINDRLEQSRTISERPFGPRGPNDGSYGPRGPSDSLFGKRLSDSSFAMGPKFGKANEAPFDKRPPFESSGSFGFSDERTLGSRKSNESLTGSCGLNESIPLGSRDPNDGPLQHNSKNFNENRFDSRDSNNGSFGSSDFKAKGPINDSVNANFPPQTDPSLNRGDYMRRNPIGQEPFEDHILPKRARYENPKPGDEFNTNCPDKNLDVDMRKENTSECVRRMPDLNTKESETAPRPGCGPNDNWKFASGQIPVAEKHNVDRNVPNIFDERSKSERAMLEPKGAPRYGESASNLFMKQAKGEQEFRVQRQFNYNHGEGDKKFVESHNYIPSKVIDYGHVTRPPIMDQHTSSVQCFDYGHGNLKPTVNREQQQQHQSKKDFKNWVENEQNLKEYTEKMSNYEKKKGHAGKMRNYTTNYDACRSMDYNKRKEHDWQSNDKTADGEKKENDDRKEREHNSDSESRVFERNIDNDQSDRYQNDKNIHKDIEIIQDIRDNSHREMNKDNDNDRLKGNVNWQENSNKNIVDTKLQETSVSPDTKKNVAESTTKTMELAKMPNYTMVDDLLCPPGRQNRPPKIAIILRGPPGSGKSFVAKLIKDKEVEQGGSAPRILSLDDYFLVEKELETKDDNGKKVTVKEMVYEYEEAMEQSYVTSLVKAFKKNITDGFFNFIILDCINEKISDYEEMWSFAKTKGFKVYVCEMEMDLQICLKRNIHNRTEDEVNRIIDYFEPTPSYHQKLDVNSMLQEQAIEEVDMEDSEETQERSAMQTEDSQDSQEDTQDTIGVSKWEKMEAEDKLDRLDGLAKRKTEAKPQTMEDFLQVPDYYNMEDTSGKKRVRWADLEERKEQEKMRAVGFVVGHTNWDRMMDPTKGGSALTRTKFFTLS